MALLKVEKLTMRFGGIVAVNAVDLVVEPGQIFSVIGPNGAGKTTVFNAITGIYEPTEGEARFEDKSLIRPFTWRVVVAAVLIGLVAGLVLSVFAVNVDALWKRAIRGNVTGVNDPFPWDKATAEARIHLSERSTTGGIAF